MYSVKNVTLEEFAPSTGSAANVESLIKSNLANTEEGKQTLLELADYLRLSVPSKSDNIDEIDWFALRNKIKHAVQISWNAKPTRLSQLSEETKKQTATTTDINVFQELYASEHLGLYQLQPNDTHQIVDDIEVIKQLIDSAYAPRIEIFNKNGELIYKGGTKEITVAVKDIVDGKRQEVKQVRQIVVNTLNKNNVNEPLSK